MTTISTLGQALDQMDRLKNMQGQMSLLQTQMTTGKKTDLYKGLGDDVITSQRARADYKKVDTYMSNITTADRRISIMTNAIGELKGQANNLSAALQNQPVEGEVDLNSIGSLADKVTDFMTNLMNQKDGDRYLFAGAETTVQPMGTTGTMDTYLQGKLNDWTAGNLSTDDMIAAYRDRTRLNDTVMGYSPQLSSGSAKNVYVRVDDNTDVSYTALANDSSMRDVLAVVGMVKALQQTVQKVALDDGDAAGTVTAPGADRHEQNNNFYKIFNDLSKMMTKAVDGLDKTVGNLSQTQAQISTMKTNHQTEKTTLANTISNVEDIDPTEVALKITTLQTQLEASYRVTAAVSSLSLVDYL